MSKNLERLTKESTEHTKRATELLKQSKAIHQAAKNGLLKEDAAMDAEIELNNLAITEAEMAIRLRNEYFAELEKDLRK